MSRNISEILFCPEQKERYSVIHHRQLEKPAYIQIWDAWSILILALLCRKMCKITKLSFCAVWRPPQFLSAAPLPKNTNPHLCRCWLQTKVIVYIALFLCWKLVCWNHRILIDLIIYYLYFFFFFLKTKSSVLLLSQKHEHTSLQQVNELVHACRGLAESCIKLDELKEAKLYFFRLFLLDLPQLFRRMLQCCFALKLPPFMSIGMRENRKWLDLNFFWELLSQQYQHICWTWVSPLYSFVYQTVRICLFFTCKIQSLQ